MSFQRWEAKDLQRGAFLSESYDRKVSSEIELLVEWNRYFDM